MNDLANKLMKIEADSKYTSDEVESYDGAKTHFYKFMVDVLAVLCEESNASRGFIALSGFRIGKFEPVAHHGHADKSIRCLRTDDPLLTKMQNANVDLGTGNSRLTLDEQSENISEHVDLKLIGHGEVIGYLCLEIALPARFDREFVSNLGQIFTLLPLLIADQNFSIRVYQLADSFEFQQLSNNPLEEFFSEIVERTALAFAADAVALRIDNKDRGSLEINKTMGRINSDLLVDRAIGEHIAGALLKDSVHDWAAINDSDDEVPTGMFISEEDRASLREAGVHACLIMRLGACIGESSGETIGTLAYHIGRPHCFSWRDLALFRLYCQRVANAITLERQTNALRNSREELELEHTLLVQQSFHVTHTDIISLLAHDLFHKSYHACFTLHKHIERVEKALKHRASDFKLVEESGENAMDAAVAIQSTLGRLRAMQQSSGQSEIEAPSRFTLKDIVDEIETTLGGPLRRNKISIKRNFSDSIMIFGPKSIFSSVLFNLTINSIDAARSRVNTRPMAITIHATSRSAGPKVTKTFIHFSDEGPGINRQVFRNPNDVFQIGRTTKVHGTGTGLPVARHLLHKHFNGDIELIDPSRALFHVTIET